MKCLAHSLTCTAFAFLFFASVQVSAQQHKYMLCIGINNYTDNNSNTIVTSDQRTIHNLHGCENDVDSISQTFVKYYGFDSANIKKLLSQQAKRDSIISSLKQFAGKCKAGDYMVFFYSGHGSLEYTDSTEKNFSKKYENSIVPADIATKNVTDINNHELNDLFLLFTSKNVKLTVIMDACHSGTNTRGTTLYELSGIREVEPSPLSFRRTIAEKKQTTVLTRQGALTLSACQDNEQSIERSFENKVYGGALTYALCKTIRQYSTASAQEIFNRTVAQLKILSVSQVPVIEMQDKRQEENLPGTAKGKKMKVAFPLITTAEPYQVQGGFLDGLSAGDILISNDKKDTVVIVDVNGPERSTIIPINKNGLLKNKDASVSYRVLWMAMPPEPPVKVYIGNGLQPDDLNKALQQAAIMKKDKTIHWIAPSGDAVPQATVYFNTDKMVWQINKNGLTNPVIINHPEAANALAILKDLNVFLELPYAASLAAALSATIKDNNNKNIGVQATPNGANYLLAGAYNSNHPEYGWLSMQWEKPQLSDAPLRTDFFEYSNSASPDKLTITSLYDRLQKLSKIRSWLTMQSPAANAGMRFPFTIKILNTKNGLLADEQQQYQKIYTGDSLKINFEKDSRSKIAWDSSRLFIYVFSIDPKGNMALLFPGERTSVFDYPRSDDDPFLVTFRNTTPGVYHYFLLSCKERILNTEVFNQQGVITRDAEYYDNPLEALINDGGVNGRGNIRTPSNWQLQRVDVLTLSKPFVKK